MNNCGVWTIVINKGRISIEETKYSWSGSLNIVNWMREDCA